MDAKEKMTNKRGTEFYLLSYMDTKPKVYLV